MLKSIVSFIAGRFFKSAPAIVITITEEVAQALQPELTKLVTSAGVPEEHAEAVVNSIIAVVNDVLGSK